MTKINQSKAHALSGAESQRLNQTTCENQQDTAAGADCDHVSGEGRVSIPSKQAVDDAKEWVDTNRL